MVAYTCTYKKCNKIPAGAVKSGGFGGQRGLACAAIRLFLNCRLAKYSKCGLRSFNICKIGMAPCNAV